MTRRACLCAAAISFALLTLPAQALGASHNLLGAIASSEAPYHTIEGACGIAFDSEGDSYISNYYHDVIHVSDRANITNEDPTNGPCGLAVDSADDVFVNNWHHEVVKFSPPSSSGAWGREGTIDPGPANGVKFDPTTDRIYVDDGTYVAAYEPSGAPVEVGGKPLHIGEGTLEEGYGLAVSAYPETAGEIYVPDAATQTVKVYDPPVSQRTPVQVIDGAGTPQKGFIELRESEAAIDPTNGHLFVIDEVGVREEVGYLRAEEVAIVVDEFNAQGDYRDQILAPPPIRNKPYLPEQYVVTHRMTEAEPSGIAIGPYSRGTEKYNDAVYVSAGNSEGGAVWIFAPTPPATDLSVTITGMGGGTVMSSPFGINCGTACAAEYNEEEKLTLYAIPDPHSNFIGWSASGPDSEGCIGTGSCSVEPLGSVEVQADFEHAPEKTLEVSLLGDGTVKSEPVGISCPPQCTEEFAEERTISLIAKPAPHQKVISFGGCESQPSLGSCKVTMSEAKSVSVKFAPITSQPLSVAVSGHGEVLSYPWGISCPGSCAARFDEGSTAYLIASADPGFALAGWSGACSGNRICAVPISQAESVGAEFTPEMPSTESPPAKPLRGFATPPTASLVLHKLHTKRGVVLVASVSGAGHLSISNGLLHHVEADPNAAGVITLRLSLNGAGQAALRRARNHRLRIRVAEMFWPSYGGTPALATAVVIFTAHRARSEAA